MVEPVVAAGRLSARLNVAAARLFALLGLLVLAACQGTGLSADGIAPEEPDAVVSGETAGTGPLRLAILLPRDEEAARNAKDAVSMAIADLGPTVLTAVFMTTDSRSLDQSAAARKAGARMAIGPITPGFAPVTVIETAKSTRSYDFAVSEADSAAAGVVAAAGGASAKVAVISPGTQAGARIEAVVRDRVSVFGGEVVSTARIDADAASVEAAASQLAAAPAKPDVVVIGGGAASPAAVVTALRERKATDGRTTIVGTSAWNAADLREARLNGAIVARPDRNEAAVVEQRFRRTYGRDADDVALHAYDLTALAVGLATAMGADGYSLAIIENDTGFRGSTGVFRFRPDGGVDRLLAIHRVRNGQLRVESKAPAAF